MSAGGLSYSGLVTNGKLTLPSVDSWGTNINILRDPTKSIMTSRINKVGETSSITTMIDDSGNRACEAIQVYARGVNPFVSVSYGNEGNNGGQRSGGITGTFQTLTTAKLPYSVMKDGAFRPPILTQYDLYPLSRLPRNITSSFTQPGFADFSRKMRTCGTAENTKEVKDTMLKAFVRPTAVYTIETPISQPFEVKYVIQPTLKTSAQSGMRTMDITQQHVGKPTKEIDSVPLHAMAHANYTDNRKYVDNNSFNPERYIQDANAHHVNSNVSSNVGAYTDIEDILDLSNLPVKEELRHASASAAFSGTEQTKYFHDDIKLSRALPEYEATTNVGNTNIYKRMEYENEIVKSRNIPMNSYVTNPTTRGDSEIGSRDIRLAQKPCVGGFNIPAQVPMHGRMQNVREDDIETEKSRINKFVMENMQNRFDKPFPQYAIH
jgi:hypothetical protein